MFNRFHKQILPKINSQIKWLDLERLSMKRILLAADYPNLHALTLFHIEHEIDLCLFADTVVLDHSTSIIPVFISLVKHKNTRTIENIDFFCAPCFSLLCIFLHTVAYSNCAFKHQISTLIITINEHKPLKQEQETDITYIAFHQIFSLFMNLICLKFQRSHQWYYVTTERLKFNHQLPTFVSSTLIELHVDVDSSNDLLYLLDGRLHQLRIFHVTVHYFQDSSQYMKREKLVNLKSFFLFCRLEVHFYDKTLVALLHRMSYLEQLSLNVCIERNIPDESIIDGNNLKNNIISYMPILNKFVFSIHSNIDHSDDVFHLPSNDDIQHTCKDFEDYQVVSYIHYFPEAKMTQYPIYSYPYYMDSLHRLTNSFPGGLFEFVHKVYLFDEQPFEHEFFIRIAKAFPYLKTLMIKNDSPQKYKQRSRSNGNHQDFPIITYPQLNHLTLFCSREHYLEQFLDNNKTCLLSCIKLHVAGDILQRVMHNFTNALTRNNCEKVSFIYDMDKNSVPKHFYDYFPHIKKL